MIKLIKSLQVVVGYVFGLNHWSTFQCALRTINFCRYLEIELYDVTVWMCQNSWCYKINTKMYIRYCKFNWNLCGICGEFIWVIPNRGRKMQTMHWCTEWWCICREAEKSVGTNLSPFLLFWCQSSNLNYFRKYSGPKSLVKLLRSNWGIRNARCRVRHIRQAVLKWGGYSA